MTREQISSLVQTKYPNWDQDSKDFYIDFLTALPNSQGLQSFELSLNTGINGDILSNISILQFNDTVSLHSDSLRPYLEQYLGEDIWEYTFKSEYLIIFFTY